MCALLYERICMRGCVCVLCCMRGVCTLYDVGTGADAEGVPER